MKLLIASDIHGSLTAAEKIIDIFTRDAFDRLVLLGDILYHGARNDLPSGYAPKEVTKLLNANSENIIAVRGNCDADIDCTVLDFELQNVLGTIYDGTLALTLSHGHIYSPEHPPKMPLGSVLLNGHTHLPAIKAYERFTYINPGSVSIPKTGSGCECGYALYENGRFALMTLSGSELNSIKLY